MRRKAEEQEQRAAEAAAQEMVHAPPAAEGSPMDVGETLPQELSFDEDWVENS